MPEVVIYTAPGCSWCTAAKRFFEEHNINYTEYDVSADPAKAEELIRISGQMGVPVIDIDGEIIIGFDKPRIAGLLGLDEA